MSSIEGESSSDEDDSLLHMLLQQFLGVHRRSSRRQRVSSREDSALHMPAPVPMEATNELNQRVPYDCGAISQCPSNVCQNLAERQRRCDLLSSGLRVSKTVNMLPRHPCVVDTFPTRVFCGVYSHDGSYFLSASQDTNVQLYDTVGGRFKRCKSVSTTDIGWSTGIVDTAFSPDQQWFVYSTWSPFLYLCNVQSGEDDRHFSLDIRPSHNFCAFSVRFSHDGNELITSGNDGCIYIYDRSICDRILKMSAHEDDVNAIEIDNNIIYSGGDDGLCRVWDRRNLSESRPTPVGTLAGHRDGITFIDSKGDGCHLVTNSKDQTAKLWDIRKFSQRTGIDATIEQVRQQNWDYRWQSIPQRAAEASLAGDSSIMTYRGHTIKQTLLRCRFSPAFTTGQKYIYSACAKGKVLIYDVLTGEIVSRLESPHCSSCIRDVSWHPFEPGELVASTWNGILQMWTFNPRADYAPLTKYSPLPEESGYY